MKKNQFNKETGRFEEVEINEKQGSFAAVPAKEKPEEECAEAKLISAKNLTAMERRIRMKKTLWQRIIEFLDSE